jgi:hypothetical protein
MTLTIADFEVPSLSELDSAEVDQVLDRLAAQLQELNPALDLKRGVFRDTVAYYHAVLETAIRTNLERYQSARSLQQIEADPTLADDTVVNEVLSNWGVTRNSGTKAAGSVTIELSAARSITVPQGSVFEANGLQYRATATFIARINAGQVVTENDRQVVALSNGNWAFTIDVEAAEVGLDYKLNAGDLIVPNSSLVSYVTSYATSTFTDGTNTETNAELLNELQLGISAKTLSNRTNMRAWLRSVVAFEGVTNQSIVGYGDPEMLRDQHTIFPISFGGRVDWYVRGQSALQRSTFQISATLMSIEDSSSTWQFSISRDMFPGFYEVSRIRRVADSALNSGFEITADVRGNDLTADGFLPDIQTVAEGAYTAFQTATIQFADTVTDTSLLNPGDTAEYVCEVTGVPLIAELQSEVSSRDIRSYAADALIKAPVPCFVQLTLTINKTAGDPSPNLDGIKAALVDAVNKVGFIGRLDGSLLTDIVHNFITDDTSVTDLDIFGRVRRPDGSIQYVRATDSLVIPDQPARMVTAKTVQFFTEVSSISINVQSVIPTAT